MNQHREKNESIEKIAEQCKFDINERLSSSWKVENVFSYQVKHFENEFVQKRTK